MNKKKKMVYFAPIHGSRHTFEKSINLVYANTYFYTTIIEFFSNKYISDFFELYDDGECVLPNKLKIKKYIKGSLGDMEGL